MFFYSNLNQPNRPRSGPSVRRLIGIIGDHPAMINRRRSSGLMHVSLDGKETLCGLVTHQMRLRLSDPVEWPGRNDACPKCKLIYRSQS